jgi:allantoin racemase
MRRLIYLVPVTGFDKGELDRRRDILNSYATKGTVVDIASIKDGPASIESFYDECMAIPNTLRLVQKASDDKYDAIIIGCYGDAGIQAAREIVDTPVIGPGESSMVIACLLGHSYSILTVMESIVPLLRGLADRVGVSSKLASVRSIGIPVLELADRGDTLEHLVEVGRLAVDKDGADVLILGCMSMAFLGLSVELQRKLNIPVVNPVQSSVKIAETLVEMGYS